ncbi:SMI1/KNR4 family protein [Hymenobacter sp. H14-R3]|uniref:SMI1/KNR4 family protein n=1 Tax=Hymenobacter sp. H14-R3 TaxID=3046308 RepID=UPI0024BACA7D|nr:SMI1/KNR4 family protein [Hymenobacter sp. H14-R3]MDJ0367259.1 SMI1/KNR4 family protein [Hymenobacter sp. H14-R3]
MVTESWHKIERWLAAHAPRILHESLNPGAPEAELAVLAAAVGRPLPADYQALYRRHNGMRDETWGSLCYGMSLLPLAAVLDAYEYHAPAQILTSPLRRAAPTVRAGALQNPYWLRLGFDYSRSWLLLDLDPAAAGTYGQVLYLDVLEELAFPVASSVAELLATFTDDLTQGLYTLDAGAQKDTYEFLVPDARISLDNWEQAERWLNAITN